MNELKKYVEKLFEGRGDTPEVRELKEEILSNMLAKKNDLVSGGMNEAQALKETMESVKSVDYLFDDVQKPEKKKNNKRIIIIIIALLLAIVILVSVPIISTFIYRRNISVNTGSSVNSIEDDRIIYELSDEFRQKQDDCFTHDITYIYKYKSPYVGDPVNTNSLVGALPLHCTESMIQIEASPIGLTVNYLAPIWDIGREKVKRNIVYNAIAIMGTIDNITYVTFEFSGDSYMFTREECENILGNPLCEFIRDTEWNLKIKSNMGNDEFLNQFYRDCDPLTD